MQPPALYCRHYDCAAASLHTPLHHRHLARRQTSACLLKSADNTDAGPFSAVMPQLHTCTAVCNISVLMNTKTGCLSHTYACLHMHVCCLQMSVELRTELIKTQAERTMSENLYQPKWLGHIAPQAKIHIIWASIFHSLKGPQDSCVGECMEMATGGKRLLKSCGAFPGNASAHPCTCTIACTIASLPAGLPCYLKSVIFQLRSQHQAAQLQKNFKCA